MSDQVRIPGFGTAVPTAEVTVELWIRVEAAKAQNTFTLWPDEPANRFLAHVPWSSGVLYWDFGNNSGAGGGRLSYTPPEPIVGTWQHFAFTAHQSPPGMWIYRNGILEVSKNQSSPFTPGTYNLLIGALTAGQIADFRIWNRARAAAEIQADMNRRLVGNGPNLVAYWPLDEGSGTTVQDATGNGHDGILEGEPQWMVSTLPPAGAVCLQESSFGQALAAQVPYPDFVTLTRLAAQWRLYPPPPRPHGSSSSRPRAEPFATRPSSTPTTPPASWP